MNLKKRTKEQLDEAVKQGDFTGGYQFLPWLIWVEIIKLLASILLPIAGIGCFIFQKGTYDLQFQIITGFCLIIAGIFVFLWTKRQYNQQKNGKSS